MTKRMRAGLTLFAAAAMTGGCGGNDASETGGADYASADAGGTKTLYVAHYLADCVGVGPMKCMLVRETPDAEWTMFYDKIQGFEYEPGFDYELRIRTEDVPNPPADASSIRYILVELVSKTPMSNEAGAGVDLVLGDWKLASFSEAVLTEAGVDVTNAMGALASKGGVTLAFTDQGQAAGFSGCNQYTGTYEIEGGHSLSFGPLAGTRKMCPPPLMELEALTLKTLEAVEGVYVRDESTLELYGADEKLLATFHRAGSAVAAGPQVGEWKLSELAPAALAEASDELLEAVTSLSADEHTTVTLNLGADGRASGFSGCNRYTGEYKTDGGSLLGLGNIAGTKRACVGPGMAIESAYLEALSSVRRMQLIGSTLELLDADGTQLLIYSRADEA
jgi:heat shock protein HslJ